MFSVILYMLRQTSPSCFPLAHSIFLSSLTLTFPKLGVILRPLYSTVYKPSRYESEALRYGHRVATLLNPRGVATVSHKYSLTVARHATVVVAVPSTVHCPPNYKIKIYYFRLNLKV
jgi:hypothetical protein